MRIHELFTVPEGEKVTEKMFTRVLASSICSILLCMACLAGATWAWFTVSVENEENTIQFADVTADITIAGAEKLADGSYSVPAGAHVIDIQLNNDANAIDDLGNPRRDVYVLMTVTHDAEAEIYCFTFSGENRQQKEMTFGSTAKVSFSVSWLQPADTKFVGAEAIVIGEAEPPVETGSKLPTEAPTENETQPTETTTPPTEETTPPTEEPTVPETEEATESTETEPTTEPVTEPTTEPTTDPTFTEPEA